MVEKILEKAVNRMIPHLEKKQPEKKQPERSICSGRRKTFPPRIPYPFSIPHSVHIPATAAMEVLSFSIIS